MDLMNHVEQILNFYNYYDGAIMVNRAGIIEYYHNSRPDINTLTDEMIVGKSLFEVYPEIKPHKSTLMEVMRTGQPIEHDFQTLNNFLGEYYSALCSTHPIFDGEIIIGAIEVFQYLKEKDKYLNIFLSSEARLIKDNRQALHEIISASDEMKNLKEKILKVAETKSGVLIYGETGTGKEIIAKAIHNNGPRRSNRFISQNCAAIPDNLLESILFGTVKGSFTGAENRKGLFEVASGGTLFLDEINSMDMAVQAKILKAVEEQRIRRVGGIEDIPVDVRIIVAANVDPEWCVEKKLLREDLYYRLRVVQLNVPPLRQRKEDIMPIVEFYTDFYNRTMGRKIKGITSEVREKFMAYSWPGNVRELRNMIEGGFNLCEGEYLDIGDLDVYSLRALDRMAAKPSDQIEAESESLKDKVRNFERKLIINTLQESENISKAAEKLGITRQTLSNKMRELKIQDAELHREG